MANQQQNGMAAPLQRAVAAAAAAAAVNYPPVLPLTMHPALRGLCKPSQNLSIGLTAAGKRINSNVCSKEKRSK